MEPEKPQNWKSGMLTYLPHSQTFALPKPFISYFMKTGATVAQRKLLHSCQYFFLRTPFYPFKQAIYDYRCTESHIACFDKAEGQETIPRTYHRFNFINAPFKISINFAFVFYPGYNFPKLASHFLQKVYHCHLEILWLHHQHISYKDYLFLTEAKILKALCFSMNVITYDNGDIVALEDILKEIPNVQQLSYTFIYDDISKTGVTKHSMKNLLKLPPFKHLNKLTFHDMPKIINPKEFAQFVLKHPQKCDYKLWYVMTQDDEVIDNFNEAFNAVIKEWKIEETKPELFVGKSSTWIDG